MIFGGTIYHYHHLHLDLLEFLREAPGIKIIPAAYMVCSPAVYVLPVPADLQAWAVAPLSLAVIIWPVLLPIAAMEQFTTP